MLETQVLHRELNGKSHPVSSKVFTGSASIAESNPPAREKTFNSLRVQVGLLYVVLTLANLVFFSAIILENQMDVLNDNVILVAERAAHQVQARLHSIASAERGESAELAAVAEHFAFTEYSVRNAKGEELKPDGTVGPANLPNFQTDLAELEARSGVIAEPYHVRVDSKGFQVAFLFPMSGKRYLTATSTLDSIKNRIRSIYWQLGLALAWGIAFHVVFGIYLLRRIFKRLSLLRETSIQLAGGDLTTRTSWLRKTGDELDTLGDTFDTMASKIESTVGQLSTANRRLRIELEIGRQVQNFFLRGHELVKEYSPALVYRPLSEVSGDIYNFFQINDRFKGVFLADATGHGVSAALVTSVIFFHLNQLLKEERSPLKIMHALSRQIKNDLNELFFATAFLLLLDSKGDIFYVNAGHNAPMVFRRSSGKLIELETTGMMLGLDLGDPRPYDMKRVPVRSGDRILLFTDGLVESADSQGEMFGNDRVIEILRASADKPGTEVVKELEAAVIGFAKSMTDDLTIMILDIP
ncbi:MAG: SpoIIE family protein phosphatase [Spirochaetia bacterium]|nr:SpoIIE family protein phosphatase [Spirochaetia bacterium]